ncbi:hypothetical protein SEPCBS119000_001639 [Sporothrix epigloea]|uniref:Uncharacterized protein n=1 Tax=Sporothrix epigloea TaxID=1892477 RepID=A0ABP0DF07_9PEZI
MDPFDAHDRRDARGVHDVHPRLPEFNGPDALASPSPANCAPDDSGNAQLLSTHSIDTQQQVLHYKPDQQQPAPSHLPSRQTSDLVTPPSASSEHSFQNSSSGQLLQPQQQQPQQQPQESRPHITIGSDSQDPLSSAATSASTDTDRLFTPPISEGDVSVEGGGSGSTNGSANASILDHDFSSQESQLLQLSRLAATRERMADISVSDAFDGGVMSRKRAADGSVKHTRNASSTSPVYVGGHSRTTSAVSVASTTGSRIGELSAELRTRLSYAMVKVHNGWQSHTIDQVENLASHVTSPASSTSTLHGWNASAHSPRTSGRAFHNRYRSQTTVSATNVASSGRTLPILDTSLWLAQQTSRSTNSTPPLPSPLVPSRSDSVAPTKSLAPPVSIQPSRPSALARRNSNPNYAPPTLMTSYSHGGPHTPADFGSAHHRTLPAHQNVREQDAIETLLFMSSPGNSSNMKQFSSTTASSQPLPIGHHDPLQTPLTNIPQRRALPGSAPRKPLPTSRQNAYGSQLPPGRHGVDDFGSREMSVEEANGTPYARLKGTPKRRVNGGLDYASEILSPRVKMPLSTPSGLTSTSKPRPVLGEDDIERMIDRAAAASADDSSDSESEIVIPNRSLGI